MRPNLERSASGEEEEVIEPLPISDGAFLQKNLASSVTKNEQRVALSDLPNWGGNLQFCHSIVKMPGKLYVQKGNIEYHTESLLSDGYRVEVAWHNWTASLNLVTFIAKKDAVEAISLELRCLKNSGHGQNGDINFATAMNLFNSYDGVKKKAGDVLSDQDRNCIHLMVSAGDFHNVSSPELISYVKEARCLEQTMALIKKYNELKIVDTEMIRTHWNPRPNRRYTEILIFISHYFGRAELIFQEETVRKLWHSLLFVNDFVIALQNQAQEYKEKMHTKPAAAGSDNASVDSNPDNMKTYEPVKNVNPTASVHNNPDKKRKSVPAENENPSAKKKSRSKKTLLEKDQPEVSKLIGFVEFVPICHLPLERMHTCLMLTAI
jgi:hypothetical protein